MKTIVVYFSYSGVTKRKAENLAGELGADSFELKAKTPYTSADVNWQDKQSRNVREYKDAKSRPEIAELPDLSEYGAVYVGYPIWWYTHPRIINTFFDTADLAGKEIHLFATSSSTGIEGSVEELKKTYPALNIADGKRI